MDATHTLLHNDHQLHNPNISTIYSPNYISLLNNDRNLTSTPSTSSYIDNFVGPYTNSLSTKFNELNKPNLSYHCDVPTHTHDKYHTPKMHKLIDYSTKRRLVLDTPFSMKSTISYGLIVYAKDTGRWAIIQRKHSVEFLLFIRGLYRLTHLPLLLSCITIEEADVIKRCIVGGPDIFKHVFLTELELDISGLKYALLRLAESRNVVTNLLLKLDLSENKLKWTWPKGRLQVSSDRETPFACAKREFTEEVEIRLPSPLYISDTYVSESVRTITGRNIESRYWIYVIPNEISMTEPHSHPEVSARQWVSTDSCSELIQHDTLFHQVANMISHSIHNI